MIAVESFKKYRFNDIIFIILFSVLWFLLVFFFGKLVDPQIYYIISLLIFSILICFIVNLIRKAGSAILFCIFSALLTFNINDFGVIGIGKLITLFIVGVIFELIFLGFKLEVKKVQFDIILASAFSLASIPIIIALKLSSNLTIIVNSLANITLLSFFIGLTGGIISFLIWHNLKNNKSLLRFQYNQ